MKQLRIMEDTLFKYRCNKCGYDNFFQSANNQVSCKSCGIYFHTTPNNVIVFENGQSEQSEHFNKLYSSGYSPTKDAFIKEYESEYKNSKHRANEALKLWGIDKKLPLKNKVILDAACGPGWLTAGLMQNRRIRNCAFHAFDISGIGLEMLANFTTQLKSTNQVEISVQNAENMRFSDNTFDVIAGHSMLHHLNHYENFLEDCLRILKPDGIAIFGEPFAVGYGLLAAACKCAQEDLEVNHAAIDNLYKNIKTRVTSPRSNLKNLVDKHLFFQSEIMQTVQDIGFRSVDFVSLLDLDYYRNHFVTNELKLSYGITDEPLIARTNQIYKTFFDLFDSDRFTHAISAFIYLILKR
jgi:ubiquinone/menaquinone biosynthesis C-methylase UbiE